MDTKSALKSLYQVVATQQEVLKKLAQMQGVPAQADDSSALTQKLQQVLFAANPLLHFSFVELPQVGTSSDASAKRIVSFKYHMSKGSEALKAAVAQAATQVLGAGAFLLQGIGE